MGKIPSKKHNKIKDPEKQRLLRDSKIKDKINNPPEDPDFQHIPKSAARLAEVMEKMRTSVGIKKKPKAKKSQPSAFFKTLGVKVTKEKEESGKTFIHRVHKACEQVLKESKFEEKYRVKIQRNPETNEVEKLVREKKVKLDDSKTELKQKGKKRKFNKEEADGDDGERVTKKNRKKMKKEAEPFREFTDKRDIVKFGDVVHAPPTLMVPHKIAKIKTSNNPGDRDLLLKTVMKRNSLILKSQSENGSRKQSKMNDKMKTSQVPDKKGKRKNLPTVIRQKLEAQQQEVIAAYKKLKKQRGNNNL